MKIQSIKLKKSQNFIFLFLTTIFVLQFALSFANAGPMFQVDANLIFTQIIDFNDDSNAPSFGDGDNIPDAGECIEFKIKIFNNGPSQQTNINGTLSTSDNYVSIVQPSGLFPDLNSNEYSVSLISFVINISTSCPENYQISFFLDLLTNNGNSRTYFGINVKGIPKLTFDYYKVTNEYDGNLTANHNKAVDPGEIDEIFVVLKNIGSGSIHTLHGIISVPETTYHKLIDSTVDFEFARNRSQANSTFKIEFYKNCPIHYSFNFKLTLVDDFNTNYTIDLIIELGGKAEFRLISIEFFELSGNHDDEIDVGEIWYPILSLQNIGDSTAENISIYLDMAQYSNYVTLLPLDQRKIRFGDILVGEIRTFTAYDSIQNIYFWQFNVSKNFDSKSLQFHINIQNSAGFSQNVQTGVYPINCIKLDVKFIFNELKGNGDARIDANEIWYITLNITNIGKIITDDLVVILSDSYYKEIAFTYSESIRTINIPSLNSNESVLLGINNREDTNTSESNTLYPWQFAVKSKVIPGRYLTFEFFIQTQNAYRWYSSTPGRINKGIFGLTESGYSILIGVGIFLLICLIGYLIYRGIKYGLKYSEHHQTFKKVMKWILIGIGITILLVFLGTWDGGYLLVILLIFALIGLAIIGSFRLEKYSRQHPKLRKNLKWGLIVASSVIGLIIFTVLLPYIFIPIYIITGIGLTIWGIYVWVNKRRLLKMSSNKIHIPTPNVYSSSNSIILPDNVPNIKKTMPIKESNSEYADNENQLSLTREYDLYGGQIRFKVGFSNFGLDVLTDITFHLMLGDEFLWVVHEPPLFKNGNSVIIPKLASNEKKSLTLYLEPRSCMNVAINASVTYFDSKNKLHAMTMEPKMVSITCPLFFTPEEANLARVKGIQRQLQCKDRKVLPILKDFLLEPLFSILLEIMNKHDIRLVSKEVSTEDQFAEAFYYGVTKVKKEQIILHIMITGSTNTIDIEISGNNQESITGLMAELDVELRAKLFQQRLIKSKDKYYDVKLSVQLNSCPYCGAEINSENKEKFHNNLNIICEYCDKIIYPY